MRFLMCPPDYYGIEYEINPWMRRSHQSNARIAQDQWRKLSRLLQTELHAEIELLDPKPGLPDMVFTANAGLAWDGKFILSRFRHDVRQREAPYYEAWFKNCGYEVLHLPDNYCFEGEGDLLKSGELWFAGYHVRSDIFSHQKIAEIIGAEILSLELTSDWYYHLDTCFCPLAAGRAIFYPPAFDSYARQVLESHIADLIAVSDEEAARFACNAVVAGDKIAMNDGCPQLTKKLEALGFSVFQTPLDEFIKAGGSAKCLVLIID